MAFVFDNTVWKTIVDTMQEGLMLVDVDGNILFVNQAFERLMGYSNDELQGKSCATFQCDRCFKARADGVDKFCVLFKDEGIRTSECIFRRKDGVPLHLLKNATVIRNERGEVTGGIETLVDLSRIVAGEKMIASLRRQLQDRSGVNRIIGKSLAMRRVLDLVGSAAHSDAPVVLYGESGTGKELLAGALHHQSDRAEGPFIKVNCAALNENLLESELFGHVKGAFTGADHARIGRFEAANGGSIFLDEIGDLPMATQTKLLRVLQEREIERVGDHRSIKIDARIITATHKNLGDLIQQGAFREDLYYRINVIPIYLPPLRERVSDIPLLVEDCIKKIRKRSGKNIEGIEGDALAVLAAYPWPGNIRELINALEYAFVVCDGANIGIKHISSTIRGGDRSVAPQPLDSSHKTEILEALQETTWNRSKAASRLGVSRVTLWKWMKKYGLGA